MHGQPIEQSRLWNLCDQIVRIDTVSTASNLPLAQLLAENLETAGMTVRLHRDHGLGVPKASLAAWCGPPAPGGLILSGHMDVVPFADQPGWTRDPLRLQRQGERMYGRGVADMKGFLAQSVETAHQLSLASLRRPLVLLFTSDEEVGCQGSGRLSPHLPALLDPCPLPPVAVIGEPTSFQAYAAHKGHVHFTLDVQGRPGHSSRPDLGANAISAMAAAAEALADLERQGIEPTTRNHLLTFPDCPRLTFNLGTIRGGTAVNAIAERCEMTVGFRPLPGMSIDRILDRVRKAVSDAVFKRVPPATVRLEDPVIAPPMASPTSGPVPDALGRLGAPISPHGAPFATDGGHFENAGIHSYIWGPGELDQAHQPNESLPIDSFVKGTELLIRLVKDICT